MAKCVWCGEETQLLVGGVPICVTCDELPKESRIKRREAAEQRVDPEQTKKPTDR
jgi:hypothetical protein